MKRMIQTGWLLASLVIIMSCNDVDKSSSNNTTKEQSTPLLTKVMPINNSQKAPSTNDIYANAAFDACHCLQPIAAKVQHLKESELNKQILEKKRTAAEIDAMQPQIQKCSDELSLKYPNLDKLINKKRIIDALHRQCPDASILFSNLPNTK